jgi:hypothetical protein
MSRLTPALLAIVPASIVVLLPLGLGTQLQTRSLADRIRAVENGPASLSRWRCGHWCSTGSA